jgi:hypothetical protein
VAAESPQEELSAGAETQFKGRINTLMKGHIYDCLDNMHAKMFTKTTKEVSIYAG